MSIPPGALDSLNSRKKNVVRTLGRVLSGLMVLLVVSIFFLIWRTESAHDEAACPFTKLSERPFLSALVIEESRSCVPEAEEHRWLVSRAGVQPREMARKRLPKERFQAGRTKWTIAEDEKNKGLIVLRIEVDGAPQSEFHESDLSAK